MVHTNPGHHPIHFKGWKKKGYRLLAEAAKETGLLVVSEIVSIKSIEQAAKYVDIFQIGAETCKISSCCGKWEGQIPVILKRGLASTIEEWLNAAEYIMNEGNYNIILCEQGIRTFETYTRNTLDLSAVPIVEIPPSHNSKIKSRHRKMEPGNSYEPCCCCCRCRWPADRGPSRSDIRPLRRSQSLNFETFDMLVDEISKVASIIGREW